MECMNTQSIEISNLHPRTRHFAERAAERKLDAQVELFILLFGTRFPDKRGVSYALIVRENVPPNLRKLPIVDRAKGWLVVIGKQGVLVTCYFDEAACKRIRRAA